MANEINVTIKITKEELKQIELTVRPVSEKYPFNRKNIYNFIIFDTETNTSGKTAVSNRSVRFTSVQQVHSVIQGC